jgi:DNA-binding LacI/PurR family transcriptional regulator
MSESEYVDMLLERQVSGMIFAGGQYAEADAPHDHYARLLKLRLPVVLVNAAAENLDFPRVSTDDAVAMEQAYGHLAYLGHERIGLILGPPDHVPSRRKLAAFEATALRATGGPLDAELVERTRFSLEGGHAAASRLIGRAVTGIVCGSDPLALGAIRAARRSGLSVPADISVVGYDDSAFMSCTDPPLTTVRQPIEAIGRAAVEMLAGQIEGSSVSTDELFFEPEIVARGSTGAARVRLEAGI